MPAPKWQEQIFQIEELRRLKAELKRVTKERDILEKAAAYFVKQSG
jgi:transposase